MRVRDALDRLDQIHGHLARAEVYRGFRAPTVALVGVAGLAAAAAQPLVTGADVGVGFVWYWAILAGGCSLLGTAATAHAYATREDALERRRTRRVAAQFLPALLAGAVVTAAVTRVPGGVGYLPGFWALLFGLGLVAARPHLPDGVGPIGLGYVAAGAFHLLRAVPGEEPSGWAVGGVFGIGHLMTALVLWRDRRGLGEEGCDD
ncbi:MAG: hypothetical protein C0501_20605 [Isosphaera sp.]|nr:hypothetical protein [Isosphaera sp.]